jgi:hypothetical protein
MSQDKREWRARCKLPAMQARVWEGETGSGRVRKTPRSMFVTVVFAACWLQFEKWNDVRKAPQLIDVVSGPLPNR